MLRPELSVVVATTQPWPAAEDCLVRVLAQADPGRVEVILSDSSGEGLPKPVPAWLQQVRWLRFPDASVFELRARATSAAGGDSIAWTEDHCLPALDWCKAVLRAHAEHPRAAAVAGGVLNGSRSSAMEWANFLTTFAPFSPPFRGRVGRTPPAANVSFKRWALGSRPLRTGEVEFRISPRLWSQHGFVFDDRIVVEHVQSKGTRGTLAAHFHNGRSTTGIFARELPFAKRMWRAAVCVAVPAAIVAGAWRSSRGKPGLRRPLSRSLPWVVGLALTHAAGELTGLMTRGPGCSPHRLE